MMLAKMSMGKKREKKGNEKKKKAIKTRMSSSKNQTAPHRTNAKKKIKKLSVSGLLCGFRLGQSAHFLFQLIK